MLRKAAQVLKCNTLLTTISNRLLAVHGVRSYATTSSSTSSKASRIPVDLKSLPPAAMKLNVRTAHTTACPSFTLPGI